ncbi:hypothetical protein Tco_0610246, partial [Tanacetum coccineum]
MGGYLFILHSLIYQRGAELVLDAEELMLPLSRAGKEIGFQHQSAYLARGSRGCYRLRFISECNSVAEESETTTEWSVMFLCDSFKGACGNHRARVKKLKWSRIAIVKVRWNSKRGPEFTWGNV